MVAPPRSPMTSPNSSQRHILIFTDLDGTLLNPDDYRYDSALPTIHQLQSRHIPVIPVTSKTRREVETLGEQIGLAEPFIVENGSGIFIPKGDRRFEVSGCEEWGNDHLMRLGCTYADARETLTKLAAALGETLRGFGDLSVEEVQQLTGLPPEEVKLAQTREFTEPFVTPKTIPPETIAREGEKLGFHITVGDRFSHLIGAEAGKGKAVRWLVERYRAMFPDAEIVTIGLGNSPNDRPMLEVVDIPAIIPGKNGPHPGLADRGWQVAPAVGCQGWGLIVEEILAKMGEKIKS
ncbi:MAG: HAD-IIB family hydrolase [Cyanobacteriota bacterium]|nr:HAD-IIB family hydrolase [Cyanobacteriota bacterium]